MQKKSQPRFTIHTFSGNGSTLHEYVSSRGVVFAVTWEGRAHPDLETVLGKYSSQYEATSKNLPREKGMRTRHAVNANNLVVERTGHVGHLVGRAYDPTLIPEGVRIEEIQ